MLQLNLYIIVAIKYTEVVCCRYLQDRLNQMTEEKSIAMATVSKYKNLLERRKNKGILKLGETRAGGVVISQRQGGSQCYINI